VRNPEKTDSTRSTPTWTAKVLEIDRVLLNEYGTPDLGNLSDPTDELFYILLSNRSDPNRYPDVFIKLKNHVGCWDRLDKVSIEEVSRLMEPIGLASQRSERFNKIAGILRERLGSVSLESIAAWEVGDALSFLKCLPGVGEKSARCVLMYCFGVDVFPIDSHIMRVASRLGLIPRRTSVIEAQRRFDSKLPTGIAKQLHVNLIVHGREVCRPSSPQCPKCCLRGLCPKKGIPHSK